MSGVDECFSNALQRFPCVATVAVLGMIGKRFSELGSTSNSESSSTRATQLFRKDFAKGMFPHLKKKKKKKKVWVKSSAVQLNHYHFVIPELFVKTGCSLEY